MAVLHVYCDESGQFQESAYTSFCGYLGQADDWEALCEKWWAFLDRTGLPPIHMRDAVHFNGETWLKKKQEWGSEAEQKRDEALCDLARIVQQYSLFCVGACVDANHFREMNTAFKHEADGDPHYLAFLKLLRMAMSQTTRFIPMYPGPITLSIVIDDHEKYSMECYKIRNKLMARHADIRAMMDGMGFVKDEHCPGVQAADMLAYEARAKLCSGVRTPLYSLLTEKAGEPYYLDAQELDEICSRWLSGRDSGDEI